MFSDYQVVPYLRVEDPQLGCVLTETPDPISKVFFDQASWKEFWDQYNTCTTDPDDSPVPVPEYSWWDRYAMVGIIDAGSCAYSGCLDRVFPLVRSVDYLNGSIRVGMIRPSQVDRGPCEACLQLRDFFLIDRKIAQKYPIELLDPLERPYTLCGVYPPPDAGP